LTGIPKEEKSTLLVNFKLHRDVVKILDRLVESGLYKTRVDVVLSALRVYEPFQKVWKKEVDEAKANETDHGVTTS
jgi:Arc/MetJ-type ribon-helix-helix transcriptional regulator